MKKLILGPPGCGKTTKLLKIVEAELAVGTPPERIAFVTFTKSGAEEAINRAMSQFDLDEKAFPHFKTLHAICYRETGCRGVMNWRHYKDLSEILGYNVQVFEKDNVMTQGQLIRNVEEQARTRCISLRDACAELAPDLNPFQVEQYKAVLMDFKKTHGYVDFTDLLENYAGSGDPLDIDVMIVDEAQDLTELQWRVVELLQASSTTRYYAGDDDQTIHVWAGANINRFMALGDFCDVEVLSHSYRLPKSIHSYVCNLQSRISSRYPKQWGPREAIGKVTRLSHAGMVNLPLKEGNWLMLARNKRNLEDYIEVLKQRGLFFTENGELYGGEWLGWIKKWEAARGGEALTYRDWSTLYTKCLFAGSFKGNKGMKYTLAQLGLKDRVWFEAFERMSSADRNYIQACLRNGEKYSAPRINLMTIHASKGRECDNVVLMSDCSRASVDEMYKQPDSEHRVFFVGASRAKEHLYLVDPSGDQFYRL